KRLVQLLAQDLDYALSPHSLFKQTTILPGGAPIPLMVCGSREDMIVDPNQLQGWQAWLKVGDHLWECASGPHFFHYFCPEQVGAQIVDFWKSLYQHPSTHSEIASLSLNTGSEPL
ncbi:MAG: alpha/beta hydrolase, partial [Cyanothece sp. SIO1E1]|nr:alpha/beta hydrolase [Cyanothece sp. SIO1E1]